MKLFIVLTVLGWCEYEVQQPFKSVCAGASRTNITTLWDRYLMFPSHAQTNANEYQSKKKKIT